MGYMHRGYEKLTEVRTYPQVTALVNRIDWLGSFANEVPFILAAEQLMEIEAPPRAQWIRTILFELSRIANIILFLGDMACSSVPSPRCSSPSATASTCSTRSRRHRRPLPPQLRPHRRPQGRPAQGLDRRHQGQVMKKLRDFCDEIEDLLFGNEIFQARTRGIGVIPADVAKQYGLSGANLRAQRRRLGPPSRQQRRPGLRQARLEGLDPPRRRQLRPLLGPPPGDPRGHQDRRPALRRPARRPGHGQGAPHHQGARGRGLGGHREPARRDGLLRGVQGRPRPVPGEDPHGSFNNVSIVPWVLRGVYVPDIITILASLYFILGDIDR
jgi:NADH-quinone oxidoreductase subunit D